MSRTIRVQLILHADTRGAIYAFALLGPTATSSTRGRGWSLEFYGLELERVLILAVKISFDVVPASARQESRDSHKNHNKATKQ